MTIHPINKQILRRIKKQLYRLTVFNNFRHGPLQTTEYKIIIVYQPALVTVNISVLF